MKFTKGMVIGNGWAVYFRHWWPRIGKIAERFEYATCTHYLFAWVGITRDKPA